MIFQRFEDFESTPHRLVLILTSYKDNLAVKTCSDIGKFAEFINQYYDGMLFGTFVYENGESDVELILGINGSFYLSPASVSGNYSNDGNKVVLNVAGSSFIYRFAVVNDDLIFDKEGSAVPEGYNWQDGATFKSKSCYSGNQEQIF
jgi:hypothetical protein